MVQNVSAFAAESMEDEPGVCPAEPCLARGMTWKGGYTISNTTRAPAAAIAAQGFARSGKGGRDVVSVCIAVAERGGQGGCLIAPLRGTARLTIGG